MLLVLLLISMALPSCREPQDRAADGPPPAANTNAAHDALAAREPEPRPPAATVSIPLPDDDHDHWLTVDGISSGNDTKPRRDGKPRQGGWATGSFDTKRNRIEITTRDVKAFSIDTARMRIDWQRLVVLSINGRTSELRHRDYALLRFAQDDHAQWVVVEPEGS